MLNTTHRIVKFNPPVTVEAMALIVETTPYANIPNQTSTAVNDYSFFKAL